MPANIEEKKRRYRRQAVVGLAMFGLLQLVCMVCFAALCFIPDLPRWTVLLFAALAVVCLVPMPFALAAFVQRLWEIEGGELDEAAGY